MRLKVKTWNNIFKGLLIICLFYLIFSAIPPTVPLGVYIGVVCSSFMAMLTFYTWHLIRKGKGDELRP